MPGDLTTGLRRPAGAPIDPATLYRLSGWTVIAGMAIDGVASVLYSRASGVELYGDPLAAADNLAKLVGTLLFLLGFPGLYAFQARKAGRLGLAGFVLTFSAFALLEIGTDALFAFVGPMLADHAQTQFLLEEYLENNLGPGFAIYLIGAYLALFTGLVAHGTATFRAKIYPRWTGPLIAIGSIAALFMAPLAAVPSGPFRLDRLGVLVMAAAFARCGWHLVRAAAGPDPGPAGSRPER